VWQKEVGWLPEVRGKAVTFLTTTERLRVHIQNVQLGSAPAVSVGTSSSLKQQAAVTASFGHVQSAESRQHWAINKIEVPLKNDREEGTENAADQHWVLFNKFRR